MNPAIRVAGLSKRYQLGLRDGIDGSFREMLVNLAKAPARRLRHLGGRGEAESFWALNDVSFEVQPGEVTGVIGRNGAGKSTLLKVLSRITEPTAGRVELRGRVASLLEVGTGFHPDLTGRENVYLNGAILGMGRAEIRRKFDAIVDFAEVAKFVDTPVKHYSSGMYLRLAFAVAAHLDGEILLVDEVLAVGDVAFQRKCLGKMQDVSRGGRSVVFVTHNMMAASALCHSGVLIDGGRVREIGPMQDVIKSYLSEVAPSEGHSWEVRDVKRTHDYGGLVTFTRVETCPQDRDGFRYGEELRFRLHATSRARLTPVFVGAGLDDIFGQRLATFESNDVNFSFDVEPGGSYAFDLRIPQPYLNPGRYFLSISLFSGQQYFDLVMHAAEFEISPIHAETGEYFEPIPGSGALRPPYHWAHGEAASSFAEQPVGERFKA